MIVDQTHAANGSAGHVEDTLPQNSCVSTTRPPILPVLLHMRMVLLSWLLLGPKQLIWQAGEGHDDDDDGGDGDDSIVSTSSALVEKKGMSCLIIVFVPLTLLALWIWSHQDQQFECGIDTI